MHKCEVCGKMTYVVHECILCKKKVCPTCFRMAIGVCLECMPGKNGTKYGAF
ncbi:MAG: hypothetical protein ACXQTP_01810 [Candidatus Methanofastidiosia archaeon]